MKTTFIAIGVALMLLPTTLSAREWPMKPPQNETLHPANTTLTRPETVQITAVGDVMIGSWYPNKGFLPDDDGKNSFAAVREHLVGDIVFANIEGAIVDDHATSAKCPPIVDETTGQSTPRPNCYAFAMPTRYASLIADAGFNLASIANNHIGDFGDIGRSSTLSALRRVGIHHAGLTQKPTASFEQNGIKYGFAAFAPNLGTVSINDIANAQRIVRQLAQQNDIVIVSFHGGAEGASHTRVPRQTEMFLGENRGNVHRFAHAVIDAGADVVIGHGPHVLRGVETHRGRFIAYSLGNFNTYGAFNLRGANGYAPILQLTVKNDGEFVSANIISGIQTKQHGLRLDPQNRAYHELKRLSQLDFPESPLQFSNDGRITP